MLFALISLSIARLCCLGKVHKPALTWQSRERDRSFHCRNISACSLVLKAMYPQNPKSYDTAVYSLEVSVGSIAAVLPSLRPLLRGGAGSNIQRFKSPKNSGSVYTNRRAQWSDARTPTPLISRDSDEQEHRGQRTLTRFLAAENPTIERNEQIELLRQDPHNILKTTKVIVSTEDAGKRSHLAQPQPSATAMVAIRRDGSM